MTKTYATAEELRREHDARMSKPEVLDFAYHRNGIGGEPFFAGLVRVPDVGQLVLAVTVPAWVADEVPDGKRVLTSSEAAQRSPSGCVPCYAVDPTAAAGPWVRPGTVDRCWRGEHFYDVMAAAIEEWLAS